MAKLRAKEGGEQITVTIGDFADIRLDDRYSLVFAVFNTFLALSSQKEQVRCFRNVAECLTEDGIFVIEAFVPDLTRFTRNQRISATRVEVDRVMLDVRRHDPVNQRHTAQLIVITEEGTQLVPTRCAMRGPRSWT